MVQKNLFDLPINAGIYTEETERGAQGRWYTANKVRFRKGLVEKIGGWTRLEPQFLGKARKIIDWSSLDGRKWVAFGTDVKLYLWQDSSLYDITPIRRTVTLGTNPFAVTSGSAIVVVTDTAHAAQEGDYVTFSGATAGGGITIDGEYQIIEILTPNTYTIEHSEPATSTDNTTGGAAVEAVYQISVGSDSTAISSGYSTGGYSSSGYSEPISDSDTVVQLRTWSLDTWGEDLLASPIGGAIYWWDRTNGPEERAVVLDETGTPQVNSYIIVSQSSRQIISLGAYDDVNGRADPLLIRWSAQEDFDTWLPTSINTAGDIRVYNGSKLITGVRTRGEIVIFTDTSVHSLNYLGTLGFAPTTLGEGVSIMSPNAAVALDHRVLFMAEEDFYIYDGVLRVLPCDVRNHVYGGLTREQRAKVNGGVNRSFNEVIWFYPALPEDYWFDGDFSLSDEDVEMETQPIGDVPLWAETFWQESFWAEEFWAEGNDEGTVVRYAVAFNSAGFIELTETPPAGSPYDAVYMLDSGAVIQNYEAVDYDMTFVLAGTPDMGMGMVFHVTDLHSIEDSFSDNIQGIAVEINPADNTIAFVKRDADGTRGDFMDNDPAAHDLGDLIEPVTLASGVTYSITVQRNGAALSLYFTDHAAALTQLVTTFDMSAAEQDLYSDGTAGILFCAADPDAAEYLPNMMQVSSFRVAALNTLLSLVPGSTEIAYTRNTSDEVTRYVLFNYEEGTWSIGTMSRTAWHDYSSIHSKPYAAGADGYLYKHETGTDDNDQPIHAYIESYMMEIPEAGEMIMHIDKLIPDFVVLDGSVDVYVRGRKYPQTQSEVEKGPFNVVNGTEFISPRLRARQVALRMESNDIGDRWRAGGWRGRAGAHGKRS